MKVVTKADVYEKRCGHSQSGNFSLICADLSSGTQFTSGHWDFREGTFLTEGGGGFLGVLSFLKSWPSPLGPLDQQKKSMTLHKRSPKNVSPSPSSHNTVAKLWISLSLCHKTNLKFCAGDSLNKYYLCIFVKKRTSVNFNSERKCCMALTRSS